MSRSLSAVVVAAGSSTRMGFDKLLTPLAGKPLLLHTLERLKAATEDTEIVVVIKPDAESQVMKAIAPLMSEGGIQMVSGGLERQDSVRAGLASVKMNPEFVMIHDAARPFLTKELVALVLEAAAETGAAVCGNPSSDTLKQVAENGSVLQTVDRRFVWQVQTPQIFRKELLDSAYNSVAKDGVQVTDDTAAVEYIGQPVRVVPYDGLNLKVTTPTDWALTRAYLTCGEPGSAEGQELRRQMHEMNNHLTPLLGYSFLVGNELPEGSKGKKYAENIGSAGERCQAVAQEMQALIRRLFPRSEELE